MVRIRLLNFPCYPLRHDWYQTESQVTVTLMVKNVKKEDVRIAFQEKEVTISSLMLCFNKGVFRHRMASVVQ